MKRLMMAVLIMSWAFSVARSEGLPDGYTELEFIRGTGEQYLDTGCVPDSKDFGFFLDFAYCDQVSSAAGEYRIVLGSSKRNKGSWGGLMVTGYAQFAGGQLSILSQTKLDAGLVSGERMQIEAKRGHYTSSTGKSFDFECSSSADFYGTVYLFAMHRDDQTPAQTGMMSGRVYRLKFYKGGETIHDFVPAKDSGGNVGLYDVVGGLGFRTSATDVPFLASTCRSVAYVQSTGLQYLDTGVTPTNSSFGFWLDFSYENKVATSGYAQVLGSSKRNSGRWGGVSVSGYPTKEGGQFVFCSAVGGTAVRNPGIVSGERFRLSLKNRIVSNSRWASSYEISTSEIKTINDFYGSFWLGKIHTETPTKFSMKGRFYGLKLYDGSRVVKSFLPCIDLGSGRAGFQELLSETFFPSATDDDFVAGPGLDSLVVRSAQAGIGRVSDGYGVREAVPGAEIRIRADSTWKDPETDVVYACRGWRLLDEAGREIDSAESLVCKFAGEGGVRELVWDWAIYRLPETGYAQVEYVEANGVQAADLNVTPGATTRVRYDFQYTAIDATKRTLGGWGASNSKELFAWGHMEKSDYGCVGYFASGTVTGWSFVSTGIALDTDRHVFDLTPGAQFFDGLIYARQTPPAATTPVDQHLYASSLHSGWVQDGLPVTASTKEKVYSCQVYTGETLTADFIPCVRTSDGAAGLYDLRRHSFHPSITGTGYVAGPAVPKPLTLGKGLLIAVW